MQTMTRVCGWTRHDATDVKPAGLTGEVEIMWFDPDETDDYRVGHSTHSTAPDQDGITIAWDHVFAYRAVKD